MAIIVQKYGGTSLADPEHIARVAARVARHHREGERLCVVLSAMAGATNHLAHLIETVAAADHDAAEADIVLASGEQVTIGLLALALAREGVAARSFTGWQAGIRTEGSHSKARIIAVDTASLKSVLDDGRVAIVAGFQGVSEDGRVTTLGRGGSDTSAVALAAALKAERCDIFTDVDGIYTTDPRIVTKARKLSRITFEEMLEMASLGAKVLQTRSVALAMQYDVPLRVLSSFDDRPGTLVCSEDDIVESKIVSGIAYSRDEAKVTIIGIEDRPGIAAALFGPLARAGINVDMIVQSVSADGTLADITFTVGRSDLARTQSLLDHERHSLGYRAYSAEAGVSKVSVVGVGMRSHAGVAHTMFSELAQKGINIQAISTSEIKVSVLIDEDFTELALRSLHTAYGLDA